MRYSSSAPGTTPRVTRPSPVMTSTMAVRVTPITSTPARNLPLITASRCRGWASSLLRVPSFHSRLIESKPRISPTSGPKKATNCTSGKPMPEEVNSIRNTKVGLTSPSRSWAIFSPAM